ncbi:MAG TPA: double-strand break repair helicase AddA [Paracoccus sp. (in: a-proteobacteria)]|nr:double-strand break repair helicase AddA [Paracoccus sp. (in: a-proteobacteria)]
MRDHIDDAPRAQHDAADPDRSTWLTANAGSGKTSVLTDRVARLLLAGTAPERILCLTYTKAAAAEMQNRLLSRLGEWAMLDDAALTGRLARMGVAAGADLNAARRLFAQAIETPGGLKVQTIHSFCGSVLRRFPLEAGVPHGFAELDDRSASALRAEIVEAMARADAPEMADLLALQSGDRLDRFLAQLRDFDGPPCERTIRAQCGLPDGLDEDRLLDDCFPGRRATVIAALIPHLRTGGKTDGKAAERLAAGDWAAPGLGELAILEQVLLTGEGAKEPFSAKIGAFPTKALRNGPCAALVDELDELMSRVEAARPHRIALAHAARTLCLQRFGHEFGRRYGAVKRAAGWLDFDDLIAHTAPLLDSAAMAQWVLFRLDGGIDHILVDEAQDTSPRQWQVIERLTTEFTAGAGAADRARTLFVVGDPKQSIYSFQGADVAVFAARRDHFARAFAQIGQPMQDAALRHSFRSSPAILSLTDATFAGERAQGLGEAPDHIAFRDALPGRVDLWPPVPEPDKPAPAPWHAPVDQVADNAASHVLAEAVAAAVREMMGTPVTLKSGQVRPIRPGDVLVLVQRRSSVFHDLIRALKQAGLPVAGADRLKLGGELAVRDIRAVLSVLATPEDDLSLACALRSPLFGLSENELYRLAAPRAGTLYQALRESGHEQARAVLFDLLGQADFLRPHDLISRLLIRHDGRARLVARLGPEAEDGIDELLAQALSYESAEIPSLTGFLVWLADDDIEVRRQPGTAGEGDGLVRVMTVHGAKGLESPVVILPDCAKRRGNPGAARMILPPGGARAHWRGTKQDRPPIIGDWIADEERRQAEERQRLLYVGLTRAESWLIVAAAGETGEAADSWHAMVAAGFDGPHGLAETRHPAPWSGEIRRLSFGDWPEGPCAAGERVEPAPVAIPPWAHEPAQPMERPPVPIAATALGGDKVLAGAAGTESDRDAALLEGTRLHLLLEHLPGRDRADWPALARTVLAGTEGGLPGDAALAALLDEAEAVVEAKGLAEIFDPPGATVLCEVALSAPLPGGGRLAGTIDRLIVAPGRVCVIDYKSNAAVPDAPEDAPQGYLRQMAAYREALRQIWPGRTVEAAILWTRARRLMTLPDPLLDAAWAQALAGVDPAGAGP